MHKNEINALLIDVAIYNDLTEQKKAEDEKRKYLIELQQYKNLTINRETRMIELKKEVNQLSKELGIPEPYDLSCLR
ncbi:MAG TPA: hypothetical protein DDX37_09150 [Candidatus Omnitrophica bacterium]|nr:hypothetical protein [Candidatus Omnitrophota bacterium]